MAKRKSDNTILLLCGIALAFVAIKHIAIKLAVPKLPPDSPNKPA